MKAVAALKRFVFSSFFLFAFFVAAKLFLLRALLFNDYQLLHTLWVEFGFILLLFLLVESAFQKTWKFLVYCLLNVVVSLLCLAFILYYDYFGTILSYYDLKQLKLVASVKESIWLLIKPFHGLFFIDFPLLIGLFFLFKSRLTAKPVFAFRTRLAGFGIIAVLLVVHFTLIDEENLLIPERFSYKHGLFNYEIYQVVHDQVTTAAGTVDFSREDIMELKGNEALPLAEDPNYGVAEGRNLLLIQLESVQNFVVGLTIAGQEVTPNLNKLLDSSFYFSNVYQQIGAGNTSDAEFLANTSLYPVGAMPTSEAAGDKEIPSLPRMLNAEGYDTATFHAHDVEYWHRDQLYPALGFQTYYDITFFEEKDVIGFGPSDEVFYDGVSDLLTSGEMREPFYAHVISLTSHTPFELPEEKIRLKLPKEYEGTFVGNYLQSVNYADYALGQFLTQLQDHGLWDDSIIAIYGDHSGVHGELLTNEDRQLLEELLGHSYTLIERFNIPFLLTVPGVTNGDEITELGGQIDMMPTIASLLALPLDDYTYFGQNLLQRYPHNLLGMRFYMPAGSFINDQLLYSPATPKIDERIFDLKTQERLSADVVDQEMQDKVIKLLYWSDAYIEQLPERSNKGM